MGRQEARAHTPAQAEPVGPSPGGADRLARARAALRHAEEHAGLRSTAQRSVERIAGNHENSLFVPLTGVGLHLVSDVPTPTVQRAHVDSASRMGASTSSMTPPHNDDGRAKEQNHLSHAQRDVVGRILQVEGGVGPLVRAAAAVGGPGAWMGFIALGNIGWVAASEAGINLERVMTIPDPGPLAADVVATLLDGVDVLCVGPVSLSHAQRRRLAARVRRDGRVVLSAVVWPALSQPYRTPMRVVGLEAV